MKQKTIVYVPTKKLEEYLPYFRYEKDENFDDIAYLLRDVNISADSILFEMAIEQIEAEYSFVDSEYQKQMELSGFQFKYVLNDDQTNSYKLIVTDKVKEMVTKAVLNIAIVDGKYEGMLLVVEYGGSYGHIDAFDCLDEEGKKFLKELLNKKMLKKKIKRFEEQDIDIDDIVSIG